MVEKRIKLNPSQARMVASDKTVVVLIGPQGEGKTFGAVGAIMYHAQRFPYKIHGAVIRDRFTSIKTNTVRSIMKAAGSIITFHDDGHVMRGPNFEADLFGVEDLADINKLQGSEYYFVWIEEPAPYFDIGSVGIREEVFDICHSRGGREEGAIDKIFVTMNPASKGHWTYRRFILHPEQDMEIIHIPYGENPHLGEVRRKKTKASYKDNPAFYSRYVKGEFAAIHLGEAVTPEFSELRHISRVPVEPREVMTFRLWDGGLSPTCVFLQIHPNGQIVCIKTLRGDNIGMKQLIQDHVKPLIATKFFKVPEWRDIGDPSLWSPDLSDSTSCPARIIEDELKTVYEEGEMSWEGRREAMKEILNMTVNGEPKFVVSNDDDIMIEALGGGWHYSKNSSGMVLTDKAVKDKHSHPGDAISHGLSKMIHPESDGKTHRRAERYETIYDPFAEERRIVMPDNEIYTNETSFDVFSQEVI